MVKMTYCIKCGSTAKKLIHHHEKYKEIHGYDKVVMICNSCHQRLHKRLRKECTCNISVETLRKISTNACARRPGMKQRGNQYSRQYQKNHREERQEYNKLYRENHRKEHREYMEQYRKDHQEERLRHSKKTMSKIEFDETMMPNVRLSDSMTYNYKTHHVTISSFFKGDHGKKLFYIDIGN